MFTSRSRTPDKPYLDSNELIINMGPQHPATHGVLRVILKLDGEKVLGTECVIGYLHRGVEKIAENRTYTMFNPYVDRMDYVRRRLERPRLLRGGREADERRSAAAREVHPRDSDGTESHRQPPALAGHARARYRRDDAAVLHLPRPGRDSQDFRKVLRRASDDACLPHRRLPVRDLRRLRKRSKEFPDVRRAENRRIRSAAHHQPHLAGAHEERGRDFRQRCHRPRRHRPGAARQRREVGSPQSAALRCTTPTSTSKSPSARTATPTTGTWCA